MDRVLEVLGLLMCCGIRLMIPIGLTLLLAWGLKRLDSHWKTEAEAKAARPEMKAITMSQIKCWEMRGCSAQKRAACPAYLQQDAACWEVYSEKGRLREMCRDCKVFGHALGLSGI